MSDVFRKRRVFLIFIIFVAFIFVIIINSLNQSESTVTIKPKINHVTSVSAIDELNKLLIKGRSPKTGYTREQFGLNWATKGGCDTRNIILNRDLTGVLIDDKCNVTSGALNDPYTGKTIYFKRGSDSSSAVQIDHVVALSDAWQKGAQQFTQTQRVALSNDPLELLAVDGVTNMQKGDGDAATWLPPNKSFRCQYVARQIAVKRKYNLWVTIGEHNAMSAILDKCPNQLLPTP